ncbi:hypothetical protein [Microbacterium marinilacus]|uniref:LPXTG cell wall anchor domain-containing protein n=1 Tax=Microbacterium marinilacus TaxID=415209 RepID=A0ABP7BJ37_9MICO|nr:hypothetical protein [Microbacterium marinilacus]MBY0689694.1 hypothetical protein [Microbacterium marinilacus]
MAVTTLAALLIAASLAAVAAAPAAVATATATVPATVTDEGLQFSADGTVWSATAPAALFDEGLALVPGESRTAALHVRNAHDAAATLTVSVVDVVADTADGFSLTAGQATGAGLSRTPLGELQGCTALIGPRVLQPGETATVEVTVDLDAALSGDQGQGSRASFALRVALADAAAGTGAAGGCSGGGVDIPGQPEVPGAAATPVPTEPADAAGGLATTGGAVSLAAVVIGLAIGGAGWWLTLLTRRRRAE